MAVSANILRRLATLRLDAEQLQEVLNIIAEMQDAEDLRLIMQRERKSRSRHKTGHVTGQSCDRPVTVTGHERDGHSDSHNSNPPEVPPRDITQPPPTPPDPLLRRDEPAVESETIQVGRASRRPAEDNSWMADVGGAWNAMASQLRLPQLTDIHSRRQALLRQRRKDLADMGHDDPIAAFDWLFNKIRGSPFLRGDRGRTPATFDWVLNLTNFHKIVDGNYEADFKATDRAPGYSH